MSETNSSTGELMSPDREALNASRPLSNEDFLPTSFGFVARINFDATEDLQALRSRKFRVTPPKVEKDIWQRQPPDFRPQAWGPNPPKRNSREAQKPWRFHSQSDERLALSKKQQEDVQLPFIMRTPRRSGEEMKTLFRLQRPRTAKQLFVKEGMHKPGSYQMPKPHDFRQYPPLKSLGLPEFQTQVDKDPYNIKFLTEQRNTIIGPLHEINNLRDCSGTLWSAVRLPNKWEPKLHLKENKWPVRSQEYTRYRQRNRQPFHAFMDRVEESLEKRWREEKTCH